MADFLTRAFQITWLIAFCCATPFVLKTATAPIVTVTSICVLSFCGVVWYFLDKRNEKKDAEQQRLKRDYSYDPDVESNIVKNGVKRRQVSVPDEVSQE